MADYWAQAAFTLDLGTPAVRDAFLGAAALLDEHDPDEPLTDELRAVFGGEPNLDLGPLADTVEPGSGDADVFVSADTQLETELLARLLQHLMRAQGLSGPLGFQWAQTCSRQRLDGFGGGAMLVWPDRIRWLSTDHWLDELGGEAEILVNLIPDPPCETVEEGPAIPSKGEAPKEPDEPTASPLEELSIEWSAPM